MTRKRKKKEEFPIEYVEQLDLGSRLRTIQRELVLICCRAIQEFATTPQGKQLFGRLDSVKLLENEKVRGEVPSNALEAQLTITEVVCEERHILGLFGVDPWDGQNGEPCDIIVTMSMSVGPLIDVNDMDP